MDPRFSFRKGYDTDLLILRSLFALNPATNQPISSMYLLTTDGIGGLNWESATQYLSSATGVPNLLSSLRTFSTNISTNSGVLNAWSTSLLTNAVSTNSVSTAAVTLSTLTLFDLVNNSRQILTASNAQLYLNGAAIVAGSGISLAQLTSSVTGLGTAGYVSTPSVTSSFVSTTRGLGTAGYLSTPSLLSSVQGLGTAGYISSAQFNALSNFVFDPVRYISTGNLLSTTDSLLSYVQNFTAGGDISSFVVYGTANFYSTLSIGTLFIDSQDVSTLSTAVGGTFETLSSSLGYNEYGWATSTQLQSSIVGLGGTGIISTGQLVSSLIGLGTLGYISSPQLTSTTAGTVDNLFPPLFASTLQGLGTAGYISSSQLTSTSQGLNGLVLPPLFASTVQGLGTARYISSTQLTSTTAGITGNVFAPNYASTVEGLGTAGYISSSQLISSINGLGGTGLVSTGQLVSTIIGLGTVGYVSTGSLVSTSAFLFSTGTYLSTGNLISTTRGLLGSFSIVNSGNIYIAGGATLNVTNANSIIYLSSFLNSTITYRGNNGTLTGSNTTSQLYFSTANLQLDSFSSYITATSVVSIDAYPTFLFDRLAYTLSDWNANVAKVPQRIFMSTFVQFGRNYFSSQMSQTMMYPIAYDSNTSNTFNQPIRISLPGSLVTATYAQQPYTLNHYLPNGISFGTTNGFSNSNITVFFGSTNSVFLSIQNLPT